MRSHSTLRHITWTIVLAAGALSTFAACQSTSEEGPGAGGRGAGVDVDAGVPVGGEGPHACAFSVAPRAEYEGWQAATEVVGANPDVRRVRLGLGGNVVAGKPGYADPATSIGVAWQTDDGTLASRIQWGASPDATTWSTGDTASGVTWITPGLNGPQRMHEVYVCGLEPATTYYYRVGGGPAGQEAWSEVHAFTTTPSDPNAKVTIAITGDSRGEQNNAWQILQSRILSKGVALQLFSGDMINLAPDQTEWEQWIDRAWKDQHGDLSTLGQVLTLAAHGNHDNHNVLFFGNMVQPQDVAAYPAYGELFFSVNVGPAHIVVFDDMWVVSSSGDAKFKAAFEGWLRADLETARASRAERPWIVAMHHHPSYSSSAHGKDADVLRGRAFLAPIWDEYDVDLVVNGHDHDYERTKPLAGDPNNPTVGASPGTTYVVCAGAGADGYGAGTSSFTAASAAYDGSTTIGTYGLIEMTRTQLHLAAHFLTPDGSDPLIDETTLGR